MGLERLVLLLGLLSVPMLAGAAVDDEQQLRDIQQRLARAWVERDHKFIEGVLAPEWSVTQPDGQVLTRATVVGPMFDTVRISSMTVDDVSVVLFGATAVVRGRTVATGTSDGVSATARIRFTDVFIKRRGKWQAVASHASVLTQ
jgi:ketosteroid isomerase-like protein